MGKVLKIGCLGLVVALGLVVILAVVGSTQPKPPQTISGQPAPVAGSTPVLAQVGQTATLGGWEVTLLDAGPWERFSPTRAPATKAQGRLLVTELRIKNLQTSTSNFTTNDISLKSDDGREFKPSGETAVIERGFMISQTVQPGLQTDNRAVFDIDPAARDLVLTVLKVQFHVPPP